VPATIPIGWVMLPESFAAYITTANTVTALTLPAVTERTRAAISNGNFVYTVRASGRPYIFSELSAIKLHIGDVVHLPAAEGDYVLLNRQPTLRTRP
jgi:hypothetical protein